MIRKISVLLFLLLLFVFPLGLLFRIRIFQNAYIVPQDIIVFGIFIMTLSKLMTNKKIIFKNKFILFQLLFLLSGGISLILNSFMHNNVNFIVSFLYLLRYVTYLSVLNIGNLIGNIRREKIMLIITGFTVLVLGYLQYFFYYDLKSLYYLGWDNHLYRLFSSFLDPNYAGVFYVILFFVLASFVLRLNLKKSYAQLMLSFFTLIAIYLTYSRTALFSLLTGVITLGILSKKFVFMAVSLFFLLIMLITVSDTSIEGLNPLRTASSVERLISLKEVSNIISGSPVIGVGFNAYRYAQLRLGFRSPAGAAISNADAGTDNSFLFVLATTGVVGFTFFVFSYYFLLNELLKDRAKIGIMPFCIVVALIFGSMFLNVLFYTPIMTFLFLLISLRKKIFSES